MTGPLIDTPDALQVYSAARQARRRRVQVDLAIGRSRNFGRGYVDPLGRRRRRRQHAERGARREPPMYSCR